MLLARFCLATHLNCLARCLPSVISQPALRIVDDILAATVAGCAGENSLADLTAVSYPPCNVGGALPGAVTTAPAQHISSVAAVERFISERGAALEGTEPSALRQVRAKRTSTGAWETNATLGGVPCERC